MELKVMISEIARLIELLVLIHNGIERLFYTKEFTLTVMVRLIHNGIESNSTIHIKTEKKYS